MKESKFIEQNKKKWVDFETMFKNKDKDPEKLSELFIEVTNDLSYARSNYPHRSIKVYLNNLANKVFTKLYKNKYGGGNKIVLFWKEKLPKVMYESRKALYLAFIVFLCAFLIGVFSSVHDPGFARHMLGDSYIDMTEEYIAEGDPMKVYKKMDHFYMFSYIALNNLVVSFRVFITGIFFGIGSIGAMISEGIRLGAFQYFFIERGLFQESFLTIWMHGAPEISSIILAGAAGMTLGGGLIFPGTYTRSEALLKGARRGIMIMLGIVPILVFAALIEGFVTRYTEVNDVVRAIIITTNFGFIIYYFVIYPYRKFHNSGDYVAFEDKIPESQMEELSFYVIRNYGEIYTNVFRIFSNNISKIIKWSAAFGVLYVISLMMIPNESIAIMFEGSNYFGRNMFDTLSVAAFKVYQLFNHSEFPILYAINPLFYAFLGTTILYHFVKNIKTPEGIDRMQLRYGEFMIRHLYKVAIYSYSYQLIFFSESIGVGVLSLIFVLPVILLFAFVGVYEDCNPFAAIDRGLKLLKSGFGIMIGYSIMIFLIDFIMNLLFNSDIIKYMLDIVLSGFDFSDSTYTLIIYGINLWVAFVSIGIFLSTAIYAAALYYFSAKERQTASSLIKRIHTLGSNKRAYGLPTED